MKKTQSQSSEGCSKRNQYTFTIDQQRTIVISSNFQNGNISLVKQVNQLNYVLEAMSDMENGGNRKCWFYFKVKAQKGIKVRLTLQNVNIFDNIYQEGSHYKPMMKEGSDGQWQQSADSFLTYRDQVVLVIEHEFKNNKEVFFCLTVPFTYQDNQQYLLNLKKFVHQNINYSDQILCLTPQKHNVHLITITEFREATGNKNDNREREQKKPMVLITARVHPGEVSSSYCLQGILDLLLSYHNLQAYLLRRLFVFKIIPMLNPDGVVKGNYRTDSQGFNLNRFYLDPDPQQHPAIYKIMELIKIVNLKQKVQYYFDLHSHSSIKESFIYGNAFDDLISQTYSELFCKILQENFPRFRCSLSNFGENHMKHKDKGEVLSKQGCGRVVLSKVCNFPCSYTVESSIFAGSYEQFIKKDVKRPQNNTEFTRLSTPSQQIYYFQPMYGLNPNYQNIIVAENKRLGKALMISILDMVQKNPYSRLKEGFNANYFKEKPAKLLANEERFKLMDMRAYSKAKNMGSQVKNKFENPLDREWHISGVSTDINKGPWPQQFRLISAFSDHSIVKVNSQTKFKKIRMSTQGKEKNVGTVSLVRKKSKNLITETNIQRNNLDSHRSISPQPNVPIKTIFPEIKYSIEMKLSKRDNLGAKTSSIKELTLYNEIGPDSKKEPKKLLLEYINDEFSKLSPEKQTLKKSNSSLNRMLANKMIYRQKSKKKDSQLNGYKNMMIGESRKRISTEIKQEQMQRTEGETKHQERYTMNEKDIFKVLEIKKADAIKKRLILNNKAVEIIRKSDRPKLKLPEVTKINLAVENMAKQKVIHTQGSQPCLPSQKYKQ